MTRVERADLETCRRASGAVVVIDVLRAFTTAAAAFGAGAEKIHLVGSVEDALHLRKDLPGSLVMGEVDGRKPEAFDLGNSPVEVAAASIRGKTLIQRTTAGTQGMVRSKGADLLLAGSFAVASQTAAFLHKQMVGKVTLVITGNHNGADGDEDTAFADYLSEALRGSAPADPTPYLERVRSSSWGRHFGASDRPYLPRHDLEFCAVLDRHPFALVGAQEAGLLTLRPVRS